MDLNLVRKHLRIDGDGAELDDLLQNYIDSAKAFIEQHCDRKLVDGEPWGPDEMALTKDVEQAILLLVGHWFTNTEGVVVGVASAEVQLGVEKLLWYRKRF